MKRVVAAASILLSVLFGWPAIGQVEHSDNIHLLGRYRTECLARNDRGRCYSRRTGGPTAFEGRRLISQYGHLDSYRITRDEPYIRRQSAYICYVNGRSISLWHGFVIQSVRGGSDQESESCNNTDDSVGKEGIRIVDARDPLHPKQVKFLETNCGSYDHTFFPVGRIIYIYDVHDLPACQQVQEGDPEPFYMRVFKLDPEHPRQARLVAEPPSARTEACNRLFVHVERALMACTSLNRAVLFDLTDPVNPTPLGVAVVKDVVDLLGESSFSWDGDYLLVDGGCNLVIIDVRDPMSPAEASRMAAPRSTSGCTNSLSVLPTKDEDRRLAVVGWGSSGLSIVDFSDPLVPVEVGYFAEDIDWAYWYNGRIYAWATEGKRRRIVLKLDGAGHRSMHFFNRFAPHTVFEDFR